MDAGLNALAQFGENLKDPVWRLSNLYQIVDKKGRKVPFRPNAAQLDFIESCSRRDIVLKARQLGITTLACLIQLDECLFNDNWRCGIIAHDLSSAAEIFETKVKFPYDNLPPEIKAAIPAVQDRAGALSFANGSKLMVSLSFRSGTLQRLHVSEFGKICARDPKKADEVITGALPAAESGSITIESTAEGQEGAFFDMTQDAIAMMDRGERLSPKDYKFHFYPWFDNPEYVMDAGAVDVPNSLRVYFEGLAINHGIKLTDDQKAWYCKESKILGGKMKREHPSTAAEAFEQALDGAYFEAQLAHANKTGAIGRYPVDPRYEVNTFWDLGRNDLSAIWLHQYIGRQNRFVGYYENSGVHISHYVMWLKQWAAQHDVQWGEHYHPHDGDRQDLYLENGRIGVVEGLGLRPRIVPRVRHKIDAIVAAETIFPSCVFDAQACEIGLKRLRAYRKAWDPRLGKWKQKPLHNRDSDAADSFLTFATGWEPPNHDHGDGYDGYDDRAGYSAATGY